MNKEKAEEITEELKDIERRIRELRNQIKEDFLRKKFCNGCLRTMEPNDNDECPYCGCLVV